MQNVIQPRSKPDSPKSTNSASGLQRWENKNIHKPDTSTQKKPNLTPRETKSPNWCPDLRHKASKRAQSHPTEAQIGPTRISKAPKRPPKTPKKPPSQLAPKGAPKRPQKTPNMRPSPKSETPYKKLRKIVLLSRGNHAFQTKHIKNTCFLPSCGKPFLALLVKIIKNTNV